MQPCKRRSPQKSNVKQAKYRARNFIRLFDDLYYRLIRDIIIGSKYFPVS